MDSSTLIFKDTFGNPEPDLSFVTTEQADLLADILNTDHPSLPVYNVLFASSLFLKTYHGDYNRLAQCAALALRGGKISREQLATLLIYINIKRDPATFPSITANNFTDLYEDLNEQSKIVTLLYQFNINSLEDIMAFRNELLSKPPSERCYFTMTIANDNNEENKVLLDYADKFYVITKKPAESFSLYYENEDEMQSSRVSTAGHITKIIFLTVGGFDALLKIKFGEHAKVLFPVCGKISINDISKKMQEGGRCVAIPYPGINASAPIHPVTAFHWFIHDLLNAYFISSIPNSLFYALQDAINLVREKSGINWTKEIWDCTNMEVADILNHYALQAQWAGISLHAIYKNQVREDVQTPDSASKLFNDLLSAKLFSESRCTGLFSASACDDTMWLLLIDMVLNRAKWEKKNIYPEKMQAYRIYYTFSQKQLAQKKIASLPSAEQVAYIKSAWFGLHYAPGRGDVGFKKIKFAEDQPFYLQVESNHQPVYASKQDCLDVLRLDGMEFNEFVNEPDDLQQKYYRYQSLNMGQLFSTADKIEMDGLYETIQITWVQRAIALVHYLVSDQCTNDKFKKLLPGFSYLDRFIDILYRSGNTKAEETLLLLFRRILEPDLLIHFSQLPNDLGWLAMTFCDFAPLLLHDFVSTIIQKDKHQVFLVSSCLGGKDYVISCIKNGIRSIKDSCQQNLSDALNCGTSEAISSFSSRLNLYKQILLSIRRNLDELQSLLGDCPTIVKTLDNLNETISGADKKILESEKSHL